jgi:recombination protein RecA
VPKALAKKALAKKDLAKKDLAQSALDIIRGWLGSESISLQRDDLVMKIPVTPTGLEVLDHYILRCGGLPRGRLIELFSEEGVGKTSLGYTFLAAAQQNGGLAAIVDTENSFDPVRAAVFGVRVSDLLIAQPDHLDEVIPQVEAMVEVLTNVAKGPAVIVWDSVAATPTREEYEGGFETKDKMGQRAKLLSRAMRIIGQRVARKDVSVVCINQVREKLGVVFGDKYTTPGGHAIKFHASVRLQLFRGKAVKNTTGEHIGTTVTIMAVKNRFAAPFRKAQVRLDYDQGWNNLWSTISHAKDKAVIPSGAKYVKKTYEEAISKLGWTPAHAVEAATDVELLAETTEAEVEDATSDCSGVQ